ncbi:hypothetical protein E3N88_23282 [Mikania micrantha]|uniref:Uncharacterized protein n=1 Tax=Mikania micrantha TaxID=192012 RepID=A0A5N6NCV5_9ASTR|nr:hypothetical protein E3N88_23282 [Mikania micrantha]
MQNLYGCYVLICISKTAAKYRKTGADCNSEDSFCENAYEKSRRLKIQENERKLKALGIRNIGNSLKTTPSCSFKCLPKGPIKKDNKGEKRKLILVDDDYDDEDDESFQVDHDVQDDEPEEMGDMLQSNGTCKRKRITMVTTSTISSERIGDLVHDDHVEDNHISETELHKTRGAPKKVRGYTTKAETWKMDRTQRIVVKFNKFGKPVGDEANELAQFLGTLVRMSDHVSIEYPDWRKVPIQNKEGMYSLVKSKFVFHPNETSEIKQWILYSMGKKWRAWKGSLKARLYDPSLTVDEIVAQQVENDKRVSETQFKELASRWFTPKFQGKKGVWVTDFSNLVNIAV